MQELIEAETSLKDEEQSSPHLDKEVLLTDWSFFLAAFASSDKSRLLWKQEVIITSAASTSLLKHRLYILVIQWWSVTFT